MMIKRICAVLVAGILAVLLCACQLALPEGKVQPQDKLCGMFITFQPLPYDNDENGDFQIDSSGAIVNTNQANPASIMPHGKEMIWVAMIIHLMAWTVYDFLHLP